MNVNTVMPIQSFAPDKLDAIYGALVGGCLAGGVAIVVNFLSNRQSLKKLGLEISHQAQQREMERQLSLKREIYIPLMEAFNNAISFYGRMGTAPSELIRQMEPLSALSRHVSKMSVVASKDVMEAVHAASKNLALETLKLMKERMRIEAFYAQIESVESQIKFLESQSASLSQRFEKHIDAGTGSAGLLEMLMQLTKEYQGSLEKLHRQKSELALQKSAVALNVAMLAARGLKAMGADHKAALMAIRIDLGFPVEEGWLSALLDANLKEVIEAVESFSDDLKTMIANSLSGKSHGDP
jgi:hypothetical protein